VSKRSLQNSQLESSCVVVALIENYSTSKSLKVSPEKSQILSCDTLVTNERYIHIQNKNTKYILKLAGSGSGERQRKREAQSMRPSLVLWHEMTVNNTSSKYICH
jgi:hypothetical protein